MAIIPALMSAFTPKKVKESPPPAAGKETPLDTWRKVTKSSKWQELPTEEKQRLRADFLNKFANDPDDVKAGLTIATAFDREEIFNLPEFRQADEDKKVKYLLGHEYAKWGNKGDSALNRAKAELYLYNMSATQAGMKRPVLAAGQVGARIGLGDKEQVDEAVSANENVAARNPSRAFSGEVLSNIATIPATGAVGAAAAKLPLLSKIPAAFENLPLLAKVLGTGTLVGAETVLTSPVDVRGGTPEEKEKSFIQEKQQQFVTGGVLGAGGALITSPPAVDLFKRTGRWVRGAFSESGRYANLGDDIIREARTRFTDIPKETLVRQAQDLADKARVMAPEEAAVKLPELLSSNEFGRTLLDMQAGAPVPDLQNFLVDNFAAKAAAKGSAISAPAVDTSTLSGRFFNTYVLPKRVMQKEATEGAIKQVEKEFTDSATRLYKTLEPQNVELTKTQLRNRTLDFLKRPDVQAQRRTLESNPAIQNILYTPKGSKIKSKLTAKNLQEYIQQSFEALEGVGGTQVKDFVDDVLRPSLGEAGSKAVDDVYDNYLKLSTQKAQNIALIKEAGKRAIKEISEKNPLIGTLSNTVNEAEIPTETISLFTGGKVLPKHVAELNPDDVKAVSGLVLADISDRFSKAKTSREKVEALAGFFEDYSNSKDAVFALVSKDKDTAKAVDGLFKIAEGLDKQLKNASASLTAQGGEIAKGLTRETTNVSSLTITQADRWLDRLRNKTFRVLRESSVDPQKTLKLLESSRNIGQSSLDYKEIWRESQGLSNILRSTVGTGGNEVVAGEIPPEQEPSLQVPSPKEVPAEVLPPSVDINEAYSTLGIPNNLKQVVLDMAGIESTFGQNLDNPRSSATGVWQFMPKTWEAVTKPEYVDAKGKTRPGLDIEAKLGRTLDINNPQDQFIAASMLAKANYDVLKRNNLEPTAQNIYVMHKFGETTGVKLLRNPSALARDLVPSIVPEQNSEVFEGNPTAKQVTDRVKRMFNTGKKQAPDKRVELQTSLSIT